MDYRYFQGDPRWIPNKIRRHLHKLRRVGVILLLTGIAIPWLIMTKVLESTFLANFAAYGLMLLGPILYLIGMVYDTWGDRSQ